MWWLIVVIVLVVAAIVGAVLVTRRRAALGFDPSGGEFTAGQRNKSTLSNPNTGLGGPSS
jgi:preprotein translocase subunit SecG